MFINLTEDDTILPLCYNQTVVSHGRPGEVIAIGKIIGYARVSSTAQHEGRQLIKLLEYGVPKRNIYIDKQSGRDFNRTDYQKMFRCLKASDLLVVKSIDRLGRNYEEILEEWKKITKQKGADIVILDMPLLDTTKSKDLLGTFIADLVLQMLSFVAENERETIRQRQKEGIAAAHLWGVKFGRPPLSMPESYAKYYEMWKDKKITAQKAVEQLGIPLWAFYQKHGR